MQASKKLSFFGNIPYAILSVTLGYSSFMPSCTTKEKETITCHSNKKIIPTLQYNDQEHQRSYPILANKVSETGTCKAGENKSNKRKEKKFDAPTHSREGKKKQKENKKKINTNFTVPWIQ